MLRALAARILQRFRRRDYVTEATRRRLAWELIERELQRAFDGPDDAEALVVAVSHPPELVPVAFLCSGCGIQLRIAVHRSVKDRLHNAWDQVHGQHQRAASAGAQP